MKNQFFFVEATDDFASFQKLNRRLMKLAPGETSFARVPIRVVLVNKACCGAGDAGSVGGVAASGCGGGGAQ